MLAVLVLGLDLALLVRRVPAVSVDLPGSGSGRTYLLLGSDSRERLTGPDRRRYADRSQSVGERADLVLLLRVGPDGAASMASVPRDLYVGREAGRPHRLGLALQSGPQEMVDSLCRDLGVGVDHLLVADFRALVELVDAAGGVSVRTATAVRDRRARLLIDGPGTHRLDGSAALAWVRSREPEIRVDDRWVPDPAADPSRSEHAAEVLDQLVDELRTSPLALHQAAWNAGPHLRRDDETGLATMTWLTRDLSQALRGGVSTVPSRRSTTQVPIAFPTEETARALATFRSPSCTTASARG